ncbi:MAG: phosphoribosylformylglycinamidine synthase I [Bacteroidota bacterium]
MAKFSILVFPGAHGDNDLKVVLESQFGIRAEMIWFRNASPFDTDVLLIPGGFPCRGSLASSQCVQDTVVIELIQNFAAKGKVVCAFGNGFQLLCEAGLLPGTLERNLSGKFICRSTYIKPDNDYLALTNQLHNDQAYQIPIATAYGRYDASEDLLREMRQDQQIIFRYCDQAGRISEAVNDTGSVDNIAGVCNKRKNVFGMIPLPERAVISGGSRNDGRLLFESLISYL